jgi:hypothetical protein
MEMGVNTMTTLLNSYTYNSKYFSQGSVAKGMLNLPDIPDGKLRIFARQWHMVASGILNAWRTPITNFKEAQWIDFHKNNKDMEYGEWMNFNIRLFCSYYCIDPAEIHFLFNNVGQSQAMFQSPEVTKLKASKDKGLIPLMQFVEDCINNWIIWRLDEDFEFRFTGLDPKDSEKAVDIQKKEVTFKKTVNEIREEDGLKPLPPEQGDLILDPQWMQAYQAEKQQEMMEQQGGEEGEEMEGGEGAPGGEEGAGTGEQPEVPDVNMNPDDWEGLLNEAAEKAVRNVGGEPLMKSTAKVKETRGGETVEYEIEI